MSEVFANGILQVAGLHEVYGFQVQPGISLPDYAYNYNGANTDTLDGLTVSQEALCTYCTPFFVPHNQAFSGNPTITDYGKYVVSGVPTFTWDSLSIQGNGMLQAFPNRPWGFEFTDFVASDDTKSTSSGMSITAVSSSAAQGWVFLLSKSIYESIDPATEAFYTIQYTVNGILFSVRISSTKASSIGYLAPNGTWTVLKSGIKVGGDNFSPIGNTGTTTNLGLIMIEAILVNATLIIKINGDSSPFTYQFSSSQLPANVDQYISGVQFTASNFTQCSFSLHPMKFLQTGYMVSNQIQLGFVPQNQIYYSLHDSWTGTILQSGEQFSFSSPPQSTATITSSLYTVGEQVQYQLAINNPSSTSGVTSFGGISFSDQTGVVTRVTVKVDPIFYPPKGSYTDISPKMITENYTLDIQALTLHHTLECVIDNFHGINNNPIIQGSGNIGVALALGYAGVSLIRRFYGIGYKYTYTTPNAAQSFIQISCQDQMVQLHDSYIAAPPDMDGWNHWYAMRFLANMASIPDSQLGFLPYVPSNPFKHVLGDPFIYFLPLGIGMHPWTPRNNTLPILDLMNYIRMAAGFMLYFDNSGILQYTPWISPSLIPVKTVFTPYPTSDLNEFWNFTAVNDTTPIRNQIITVGIDAYGAAWSPIVTKIEDTNSIYATGPYPFNYVGYRKPFIWVDARFANQEFAVLAARSIYDIMRLPELSVSFNCWMQPGIFPMDVIEIDEYKSNAQGTHFYVTGIQNVWSIMSGKQIMQCTITGRFLG